MGWVGATIATQSLTQVHPRLQADYEAPKEQRNELEPQHLKKHPV
jgi:hypothetical protein